MGRHASSRAPARQCLELSTHQESPAPPSSPLPLRALAAPAVLVMSVSQGCCLGQQDAWTPFGVLMAAGLLNAGGWAPLGMLATPDLSAAPGVGRRTRRAALPAHTDIQPAALTCRHPCLATRAVGDVWLIHGCGMGVAGAAAATAAAQVRLSGGVGCEATVAGPWHLAGELACCCAVLW